MTEPKQTGLKKGFLFGIRTGEQNKTYTLSVDASCPTEAIAELRNALTALETRSSHFASGENNVMMIGNVAATSRYKAAPNPTTQLSGDQRRLEAESAVPKTVLPHQS